MFIYSHKIISFINDLKFEIKRVLQKEVGLKVHGDRFYNWEKSASYPINPVIYNNKSPLAYFNPDFYELGFHHCLMHANQKQLVDIIRHEIAHYMVFILQGERCSQPHGEEFRTFCKSLGWGEEVYKATICLEGAENVEGIESAILRKIQKLMALASSNNRHEAELAMIKARELLLNHNIELTSLSVDEEIIFVKRVLKQKRENAKFRTIARILETFFVNVVYNRGGGEVHLEILGTKVNLEIAEYVAHFLNSALDEQWNNVRKLASLKGTVAKNSFFLGLAKGYCEKVEALKKQHVQALMVIENKLTLAKEMVYPRLSYGRSGGAVCPNASALGEKMGRELTINPVLKKASNTETIHCLT